MNQRKEQTKRGTPEKNEYKNSEKKKENTTVSLDDDQRIKVLSPSMLVIKRFMRNRLAIAGFIIIIAMFLFSFLGGLVTPYREAQVFKTYEDMPKDYAGAAVNREFRYTVKEKDTCSRSIQSAFILAFNQKKESFEVDGVVYGIQKINEELYEIVQLQQIATITVLRGTYFFENSEEAMVSANLERAVEEAISQKATSFQQEGTLYTLNKVGRMYELSIGNEVAIVSYLSLDFSVSKSTLGYDFSKNAQIACSEKMETFQADEKDYIVERFHQAAVIYDAITREEVAMVSRWTIQAISPDVELSLDFKRTIMEAMDAKKEGITYKDAEGVESTYEFVNDNGQYRIRKEILTEKISLYESPSKEHWLGTDGNGMDILTRLMYGGRISLLIGFIVVFFEVILGVILGGIAGYFSDWVDMMIMRIVDIFNCIPQTPLIIILGSVMDSLKVNPKVRIYYLMLILGMLGWPSVARIVRGQILSLREQEFMTATEATGLSIHRRIFKHLIPNVIPQLIVIATMSLGNIILMESTLSFLGLGVKFPYASWGNIINAVNDVHVMTSYWFIWIPAGLCILLTVLGFNFIGDGLRDAFDPKMKR